MGSQYEIKEGFCFPGSLKHPSSSSVGQEAKPNSAPAAIEESHAHEEDTQKQQTGTHVNDNDLQAPSTDSATMANTNSSRKFYELTEVIIDQLQAASALHLSHQALLKYLAPRLLTAKGNQSTTSIQLHSFSSAVLPEHSTMRLRGRVILMRSTDASRGGADTLLSSLPTPHGKSWTYIGRISL